MTALKAAGLARGGKDGVRLLGKGELTAKLSVQGRRRVEGRERGDREGRRRGRGDRARLRRRQGQGQEEQRQEAARTRPSLPRRRFRRLTSRNRSLYEAAGRLLALPPPFQFPEGRTLHGIRSRTNGRQHQPGNFSKATDLKKRLWFTLGALVVFRLLSLRAAAGHRSALRSARSSSTTQGGVLDFFNMFSGGSLERMSLIALGVMPYITASIVDAARRPPCRRSSPRSRKRARAAARRSTNIPATARFSCARSRAISWPSASRAGARAGPVGGAHPGLMFRVTAVINLVGGTMFLMWLGEQITSRGIGNGVSLIIMAGIVAQMPQRSRRLFEGGRSGSLDPLVIIGDRRAGRGPDPVHLLHGARPAPGADPVSQAPDRARPDRSRSAPPAAQGQHRRRDPADLRLARCCCCR